MVKDIQWHGVFPREDQVLLQNSIKKKVGMLSPKYFMSDLAEQFYSAWIAVFYSIKPPNKLICTWHVDHAWRENLKKFTNSELKATLYHNLRVLLEETDVHMFELLLERMIQNTKDSNVTFGLDNMNSLLHYKWLFLELVI